MKGSPQKLGEDMAKSIRGHGIRFEAIGSRIEIIGGSIYPKEESWSFLCPCCGKWLKGKLVWDQEACEFSFSVDKEERK